MFTPRRIAVLSDGRLVISGLGQGASLANEETGWGKKWSLVQVLGGNSSPVPKWHLGALTSVGSLLIGQEHGKYGHVYLFEQSLLRGTPSILTSNECGPSLPGYALDIVYSGGVCYVLDAPKPIKFKMWRIRVITYKKR